MSGTGVNSVRAINETTGAIIWSSPLHDTSGGNSKSIEVPGLILGDYIYFPTGAYLFKLLKSTGAVVWNSSIIESYGYAGEILGTPVYANGLIICGVSGQDEQTFPYNLFRGRVVAFDSNFGKLIWVHYTTSDQNVTNPVYSRGGGSYSAAAVDLTRNLLFIGTDNGRTYNPPAGPESDSLIALDLSTGTLVWNYQFQANDAFSNFPNTPANYSLILGSYDHDVGQHPNLFTINNIDYVGVGNKGGFYKIFNRDQTGVTGIPLVDISLAPGGANSGPLQGMAAVNNGILYITANSAIVNGSLVSTDYVANGFTPSQYLNPYLFANNTNVKIYALDLGVLLSAGNTNGVIPPNAIVWTADEPGYSYGVITYVNGVIMYTNQVTGIVSVRSAHSGKLLWSTEVFQVDATHSVLHVSYTGLVPVALFGGVTIADNRIFVPFSGYSAFNGFLTFDGGIASYKISEICL